MKEYRYPDGTAFVEDAPGDGYGRIVFPKSVKAIGNFVFIGDSFEEIVFSEGLEEIGAGAFDECGGLRRVTLPKSLKQIGDNAFENCTALEEVVFSGDGPAAIGDAVFHGCTALERVVLPKGLLTVGSDPAFCGAFEDCSSLRGISLPEGLETLSPGTFKGCSSLEKIALPKSLRVLGEEALAGTALKELTVPEGVAFLRNVALGCERLERLVLPSTLKGLAYMEFGGHPRLREVVLPRRFEADLSLYINRADRPRVQFIFI